MEKQIRRGSGRQGRKEWECQPGGARGALKKGDGVGEEDKRKKLEKVGGAEGVEASGDIQFQVEVVKFKKKSLPSL